VARPSSATLAEKDVTLAFARRLPPGTREPRHRHPPPAAIPDANLSLDDRAFFATPRTQPVYVVLHATSTGHGVRVYTSMLPYSNGDDRGPFRSWPTAQASFLPLSNLVAGSVSEALKRDENHRPYTHHALRPLNNIVTAAIAVRSGTARFGYLCAHRTRLSATHFRRRSQWNRRHSQFSSEPPHKEIGPWCNRAIYRFDNLGAVGFPIAPITKSSDSALMVPRHLYTRSQCCWPPCSA